MQVVGNSLAEPFFALDESDDFLWAVRCEFVLFLDDAELFQNLLGLRAGLFRVRLVRSTGNRVEYRDRFADVETERAGRRGDLRNCRSIVT